MKYREVEVYAPTDLGAAGTKTIDINLTDIVSSLEIIWKFTVNTGDALTAPISDCISKIELVDGSDVLFSLSGSEAQALAFYATGVMPHNYITLKANDEAVCVIPILFGYKLFDPEYAMDFTKFKNPQLKITWDEDAANSGVTTNSLSVRAWAFDEVQPRPRGFLMAKNIKSFTPSANTYEYTDLPLDYPYRLMLLRCKSDDLSPVSQLSEIKLSEEHDKRIPYDITPSELFQKIIAPLGRIEEYVRLGESANAQTIYTAVTHLHDGVIDLAYADADTGASGTPSPTYSANKVSIAAKANCTYYKMLVSGYCPHFCLLLPFGDISDDRDAYDVRKLKNLRLTLKGASSVGTNPEVSIILQQVRYY